MIRHGVEKNISWETLPRVSPPLPPAATCALPGTEAKILEMIERRRKGQSLHHPKDAGVPSGRRQEGVWQEEGQPLAALPLEPAEGTYKRFLQSLQKEPDESHDIRPGEPRLADLA